MLTVWLSECLLLLLLLFLKHVYTAMTVGPDLNEQFSCLGKPVHKLLVQDTK